MNPDQIKKALDAIESGDAAGALEILKAILVGLASDEASEDDGGDDTADAGAEAPDAPPSGDGSPVVAASRELLRLTGRATIGEAVEEVRRLTSEARQMRADRDALDLNARQGLVAELVKLGIETPALAWEGTTDEERAKRKPVARLMSEPLESLRERVRVLSQLRPAVRRPVEGSGTDLSRLSADERAAAEKITDPAKRAKFVALRLSRRSAES